MNDSIDRQAAIEAIKKRADKARDMVGSDYSFWEGLIVALVIVEQLSSAQPERKGKWIEMGTNKDGTHSIRCSKCGGGYKTRGHARSIATKAKYKFCPNCGAYMRGESDG